MIDYYNGLPSGINVIDKMNEELDDLQKKYSALEQKVIDLEKLVDLIGTSLIGHNLLVAGKQPISNSNYWEIIREKTKKLPNIQ